MNYVKREPHPVKRILSQEDRDAILKSIPAPERRLRHLVQMCADCEMSVAMDKFGRYRHVR